MKQQTKEKIVHENPIYGDKAVFLTTSEESNGKLTLIDIELSVNGGNTKHYHGSYSETFTVTEGELTLFADGKFITLKKDESFLVNPKVVHYFKNNTQKKVRFLVEFQPGQPGFEKALMIGYGLAKDGLTNKKGIPKKFSHLALLIVLSGAQVPGLFKMIDPLFKWVAKRADKKGELQELVNQYCH
jgi:quercetin dioxygenase-like cupin family protein